MVADASALRARAQVGAHPAVLCVDDDPLVLAGLARQLRASYEVQIAVGGDEGLAWLEIQPFSIIISDMRMPHMNGAQFLARAREAAPDAVRILLTGHADVAQAVAAINEGNVFRFLCKPCRTEELLRHLDAAMELVRLRDTERLLLEQTLRGSVHALLETLSLANPMAFGSANRVRALVGRLCHQLGVKDTWEIEIAAMLAHIGAVTLPPSVIEKHRQGVALGAEEAAMIERQPAIAAGLLTTIPRLERVRAMILQRSGPVGESSPQGARILKVAFDAELLEARGLSCAEVRERLLAEPGAYDAAVVRAYMHEQPAPLVTEAEVLVEELCVGMTLTADVRTHAGMLLVARGHKITQGILSRIKNFASGLGVAEPLRVTT